MRLIHIVPAITEESSGPTYSVTSLCNALQQCGEQVELAALDLAPMVSPPLFLKTFPLGFGPRRLGRSPAMLHWLDKQVQSSNVDLLHSHGMWQMSAVYPGWAAKKGKIKLVVSPRGAFSEWAMRHGSRAKKVFWPTLQRPALDRATCFHATAESEYEDIRRLNFRQPVAIIPNGIDIPDLGVKTQGDARTLLFLGRIHPVKGLDMLLPAWRMVQDHFPDWRMIIVGSDHGFYGNNGYLNELHLKASDLQLKRVEFVGELRGTEKMRTYHDAELFILPSYSENFGMTVAEALAVGTPAIVTSGAPWQALQSNDAGWWIDISVDSIASALGTAMRCTPNELMQRGFNGREWMIRDFGWKEIGEKMKQTYHWLEAGGVPPAWVRLD